MRLINADLLLAHIGIQYCENGWNSDEEHLSWLDLIDQIDKEHVVKQEDNDENVEICVFDQEEIHPNCTVQVLKNSITGDLSVGWWENE